VELQKVVDVLQEEGVALFAISYDPVDTLRAFAAKYGIAYPLLSDSGSTTIHRLGMLDDELERHHREFGIATRDEQRGVAYPGIFLLDRDGIVVKKRFHKNYRIRDTGAGIVEAILGTPAVERGAAATAPGGVVQARLSFDSPAFRPYQQLQLTIMLTIEREWHVYAAPVPDGYTALSLEITPVTGLELGTAAWPRPRPFQLEGLEDRFLVHEGTIRGMVPVTFAFAPGSGRQIVRAGIRYQVCSASQCLSPAEMRFELVMPELPRAE
jgi:peroxiredoxin